MNKFACIVYVGVFLALPPILLGSRLLDRTCMTWLQLFAASAIGGWLLVNLAHWFFLNSLRVQMSLAGNPGASQHASQSSEFLFNFGWLLGPAYLLPWLFAYLAFVFARWLWRSRR